MKNSHLEQLLENSAWSSFCFVSTWPRVLEHWCSLEVSTFQGQSCMKLVEKDQEKSDVMLVKYFFILVVIAPSPRLHKSEKYIFFDLLYSCVVPLL